MNQAQRRIFLIKSLIKEQPQYQEIKIPRSDIEQKRLLRSLMNVRGPEKIGDDFLAV